MAYSTTVDWLSGAAPKGAYYFLLILHPKDETLRIEVFGKRDFQSASLAYSAAERKSATDGGDAVLVNVDSMKQLSRAYPNYFGDTSEFLKSLRRVLRGKSQ